MEYHNKKELAAALTRQMIDSDLICIQNFGSEKDANEATVDVILSFLQDFTIVPGTPIE